MVTSEDCLAAGLAERAEDWPDAGVEVRRRDRRRARARHHRARRLRGGARRAAADRRRGPLPARAPGARPPRPRLTDARRRAHTPSYGPFRQPAGPSSAPRGVPVGPPTPPKGLPVKPRLAASMHARATPRLEQRLPGRSIAAPPSDDSSTRISLCLCSFSSLEEPRRKTRRAPLPAVPSDSSSPPVAPPRHNERHS